ncbi:GNAT family N-acetyltransferase [Salirhabdus salicampi]|uniref:GNAT family N-acetyltransferase n=1 Tax=Salirhabdus salicampi TaxID=476102 RepID=UPI0020C463DF|nr:GNAT family N-acetyltransferase [Salirhabdus salicampi]MCP8615286.1 GNAT family N-acetyltransferase [Salirhabdus salicampi]
MKFTIRPITENDISPVQQIARRSWNETYDGIIPKDIQERFISFAYSNEMMQKRVEKSIMYVAEVNEKVVGFANFSPINTAGFTELDAIYLDSQYHGNGIGTSLLEEGLKQLHHANKVYVNVEKENDSGVHFYYAKGFEVESEYEDNFDGHKLQTVRMVKHL